MLSRTIITCCCRLICSCFFIAYLCSTLPNLILCSCICVSFIRDFSIISFVLSTCTFFCYTSISRSCLIISQSSSVSSLIDLAYSSFFVLTLWTECDVLERSSFMRDTLSAAYLDVDQLTRTIRLFKIYLPFEATPSILVIFIESTSSSHIFYESSPRFGFDAIFISRCILADLIIVGPLPVRGARAIRLGTSKTDTCGCCFTPEYGAWALFIDFFNRFLEPQSLVTPRSQPQAQGYSY